MTNSTEIAGQAVTLSQPALLHPEYMLLFVPAFIFFAWYVGRGGLNRRKVSFLAVRSLILLLITVSLASPVYYESRKTLQDLPPVTVLVDYSASMASYPDAAATGYFLLDRIRGAVGNLTGKSQNVKFEYFSEGNRTAIGDALYNTMLQYSGEPVSVILISDGVNNWGRNPLDMARVMAQANSTIYALKPDRKLQDVWVDSVSGDKKIPSNTQYDFVVRVRKVGLKDASYGLNVYLDNTPKFEGRFTQAESVKDIPLTLQLKNIGIHQLRVEVDSQNEAFPQNDVYYKVVDVVEKPKILLVSGNSTSPLLDVLNRLYAVDVTTRADNDYSKYSAVIFDNVNAADLDRTRVNKLKKYILDGGGVAFVGGKNSFEYGGYNNSFVENILPVKSMEKPTERRRDFAVVFMVDISQSTEYGSGTDSKIDVEKAVVLGMLRAMNSNDSVGVVAFNNMPYLVSPISPLGDKLSTVEDSILRLKFGGGTDMQYALESSDAMLSGYTVDKYLIIVSDGVIQLSRMQLALNKIAQMHDSGVKTFTVGVGFDTAETFMQDLALSGGGQYFSLKSNPENRLKITFGEEADDKTKDQTPVVRRDEYHYITRNLVELDTTGAQVTGFNKVQEKNVAQLLLSTRGGKPILTVWHFGLGRVAAFTADNGLDWGQELMKVDSGRVVSGMTNWLIGDLEKGKPLRITGTDAHLGGPVEVSVKSPSLPQAEYKNLQTMEQAPIYLTRGGITAYSGYFTPQSGGFYGISALADKSRDEDEVAVNYPLEYGALDVDEDTLRRVAAATGSRLYSSEELDTIVSDLMAKVEKASTKELKDKKDLWMYFAAAALGVYFLDAAIRRLMVLFRKEPD
jgi:Mg-chelatase subunit ChlD